MRRTTVFSVQSEKLYFFILGLLFAIWLLGSAFHFNVSAQSTIFVFLTGFLFMNITHVFFTFAMLIYIPEFRVLIFKKMKSKAAFLIVPMFIMILFWSVAKVFFKAPDLGGYAREPYEIISLLLSSIFAIHSSAQVLGLSMLYNKNNISKIDPPHLEKHFLCEKRERQLFFLLFIALVLRFIIPVFQKNGQEFKELSFFICLTLVSAIWINSFFYPEIRHSNKRFFLMSLFLFVFAFTSPLAFFGAQCLHGLEYGLLTKDIFKRAKVKWHFIGVFTIVIAGVLILFATSAVYLHVFSQESSFYPWLWLVTLIGAHLHYFLDSQIFKMSDPENRQHIGSLLIFSPEEISATNLRNKNANPKAI